MRKATTKATPTTKAATTTSRLAEMNLQGDVVMNGVRTHTEVTGGT